MIEYSKKKFSIWMILFFPICAYANSGLPMIMITLPGMLIALIPIVALEIFIIRRKLGDLVNFKQAFKVVLYSNLFSTLIGIPFTWLILFGLQFISGGLYSYGISSFRQKLLAVTWQAPWLIPYEGEFGWMVPAATLVLLIPFFYISWLSEWKIASFNLKEIPSKKIKSAFFSANKWSYLFLALGTTIELIRQIIKH